MATFPSSLPRPSAQGYRIDPMDQVIRTDMEVGMPRARRRTLARNDQVAASWLFTDAQFSVFRAWFERADGAAGGAGWFDILMAYGDMGLRTREARFVGPFSADALSGLLWTVTAKLEVRGNTLTADQSLAAVLGLVPSSGIYPTLMLDFISGVLDSRVAFTRASTGTHFDAAGVLVTAASGAPRFDHDPITHESLGILIEEQRTNLLLYSEDFSNAAWIKQAPATITPDTATSPASPTPGDTLNGVQDVGVYQAVTVSNATQYTCSVYLKAGTASNIRFRDVAGALGHHIDVNPVTGGILATSNVSASGSQYVGNGWWRVWMTYTTDTTSIGLNIRPNDAGSTTVNVYGAQIEAGAMPTSYIATTSAAATRAADNARLVGGAFTAFANAGEGTLLAQYRVPVDAPASLYPCAWGFSDGTANNRLGLYASTASDTNCAYMQASGVETANIVSGVLGYGATVRAAMAYKVNDFAAAFNGVLGATDTSCALPSLNQAHVGELYPGAGVLNGPVARVAFYPQRLSNADLTELTSA